MGVLLFFVAPVALDAPVAAVIVDATETLPFELMILARGPLLTGGGVVIAIIAEEEGAEMAVDAGGAPVATGPVVPDGLFDEDV